MHYKCQQIWSKYNKCTLQNLTEKPPQTADNGINVCASRLWNHCKFQLQSHGKCSMHLSWDSSFLFARVMPKFDWLECHRHHRAAVATITSIFTAPPLSTNTIVISLRFSKWFHNPFAQCVCSLAFICLCKTGIWTLILCVLDHWVMASKMQSKLTRTFRNWEWCGRDREREKLSIRMHKSICLNNLLSVCFFRFHVIIILSFIVRHKIGEGI